ncbi:MAG: phosphoribosylanthranilate isomerase [Candidatus Woesearchaeota archaeon]
MLVKICGVSNAIDAFYAIRHGADAIGFVMGGKVLPPEVEPHAQTVKEIIKQFPKGVESFVVTHLKDAESILALADYVNSTGIQVSEDVGVEVMKDVRAGTSRKIIKTVVVEEEGSLEKLKAYEPYCDFILLDTRAGGYVGGTGVTNDWKLCKMMIAAAKKPVFLAGGLNPENLQDAISATSPQGVDVSTGVSHYSKDYLKKDRKDQQKIRAFIDIAKGRIT